MMLPRCRTKFRVSRDGRRVAQIPHDVHVFGVNDARARGPPKVDPSDGGRRNMPFVICYVTIYRIIVVVPIEYNTIIYINDEWDLKKYIHGCVFVVKPGRIVVTYPE